MFTPGVYEATGTVTSLQSTQVVLFRKGQQIEIVEVSEVVEFRRLPDKGTGWLHPLLIDEKLFKRVD